MHHVPFALLSLGGAADPLPGVVLSALDEARRGQWRVSGTREHDSLFLGDRLMLLGQQNNELYLREMRRQMPEAPSPQS